MQPDESSQYRIDSESGAAHPYPPPAYGAVPGYPQGYGPPPAGWYWPAAPGWNWPVSRRWPYGPDRPGVATAAAVLGFVAAGLTVIASIGFIDSFATGDGDLPTALLLLGLPCAVGLIVGGVQLLHRRSRAVLFASALAAVAVLVAALVAAVLTFTRDDLVGIGVFLVLAAPLPIVTACLAGARTVSSWLAAARTA